MFPHLCFQRCDLPHLSWVTWLSEDTFSEYLNSPRWDDVRNTCKDDVPSEPLRTPFWILSLHFTSAHSETFRVVVALIPRFSVLWWLPYHVMMWGSKRPTPGELHDNMNLYMPQSPNVYDTIRRCTWNASVISQKIELPDSDVPSALHTKCFQKNTGNIVTSDSIFCVICVGGG